MSLEGIWKKLWPIHKILWNLWKKKLSPVKTDKEWLTPSCKLCMIHKLWKIGFFSCERIENERKKKKCCCKNFTLERYRNVKVMCVRTQPTAVRVIQCLRERETYFEFFSATAPMSAATIMKNINLHPQNDWLFKAFNFFFFFWEFKVDVLKNYIKNFSSVQHHHKFSSISILTYAQWIISIFFPIPPNSSLNDVSFHSMWKRMPEKKSFSFCEWNWCSKKKKKKS